MTPEPFTSDHQLSVPAAALRNKPVVPRNDLFELLVRLNG
ncbi:hypothetical protein J2Z21_002941 [Streptomyces griseochromogenes]|uniref:Transposase n=1 Tax=Streptomyces griseochromogenes TaxID=68214 RepID=A0ABS4LRH5_9ACTN|nr:hypothetical protein [Streptomyces griseochromogenes]